MQRTSPDTSKMGNGGQPSVNTRLSDSMAVNSVIRRIATIHGWTDEQVVTDLAILKHNRVYTVGELRVLSSRSWDCIKLLPLVKDLLRIEIARGSDRERSELATTVAEEGEGQPQDQGRENHHQQLVVTHERDRADLVGVRMRTPTVPEEPTPIPPIILPASPPSASSSPPMPRALRRKPSRQVLGDRIRVRTTDGRSYEVDRWCPHNNADLASRGVVIGHRLVCTRHCWTFDLENGGQCVDNPASINACQIADDW